MKVCGSCVVTFIEWLQDGKRTKSCYVCGQDFELLGLEFAGMPVEYHSSNKVIPNDPCKESQHYLDTIKKESQKKRKYNPARVLFPAAKEDTPLSKLPVITPRRSVIYDGNMKQLNL